MTTLEVYGCTHRLREAVRRLNKIASDAEIRLSWIAPAKTLEELLADFDEEMDRLRDLRGRIWDALEGRTP